MPRPRYGVRKAPLSVILVLAVGCAVVGAGREGGVAAAAAPASAAGGAPAGLAGGQLSRSQMINPAEGMGSEPVKGAHTTTRPVNSSLVPSEGTVVPANAPQGWQWFSSPDLGTNVVLNAVACSGASECWAVGSYDPAGTDLVTQPLIKEWDGDSWENVATPAPPGGIADLEGVTCVSATDCWAVGYSGTGTLTERWTGSLWQIVAPPTGAIDGLFSGVACVNSTDCWAVGNDNGSTLIEQWNGTSWQVVTSPDPYTYGYPSSDTLSGVACAGSDECWAVGSYTSNGVNGLIAQWSGSTWSEAALPMGDTLEAVTCAGADDCWAVGYGDYSSVIEQWAGTTWASVSNPVTPVFDLFGVTCVGTTDCWAVGYGIDSSAVVEQWTGSEWDLATQSPGAAADLTAVSCVNATDCWAVGAGITYQSVIEGLYELPGPWTLASGLGGGSLYADTCVAADDCWAVGSSADGAQTLIEQNSGDGWGTVLSPTPAGATSSYLNGVSCAGATDCWAVGDYTTGSGVSQALIEWYNGSTWSIVSSTTVGINGVQDIWLYGVTCASSTECWAAGQYEDSGDYLHPLLARYDGSWIISSPPYGDALNSVTCVTPSDCWAVGESYNGTAFQTLTYQYVGSSWSMVSSPDVLDAVFNDLFSVSCAGPDDCWADGSEYYSSVDDNDQGIMMQYDGAGWSMTTSPGAGFATNLLGVTCVSSTDCWAAGVYISAYSNLPQALLAQYAGGELWSSNSGTDASSDDGLSGVACDGTVNCWAVGASYSDGVYQSLIEQSVQADSPPMVTSLTPAAGPLAGGQTVTVSGYGFPTDGSMSATLGGVSVTPANVTSTSFTFTTPAGNAGQVYLRATDVDGSSLADSNSAYTYAVPPVVTSVTPSSGTSLGGQLVTIRGTGFAAGATVDFGSSQAAPVQFISSTQLTAVTPAGAVGTVGVTVINPVGMSSTDPSAYTYAGSAPPPTAYTPLQPYRICDTRSVATTGYSTECSGSSIGQDSTLDVQITGVTGYAGQAVPSDAQSVVLNVTAIGGSATTYLTVFPAGSTPPNASNLNVTAGINQANLVVVALGPAGKVGIYNSAGTINVAVDVEGYFDPASGSSSGAGLFHPVAPLRICDTRSTSVTGYSTECSGDSLGQGQWEKVVVSGCPAGDPSCSASIPTSDAASAVLNLTAVSGTASTFLSVVPPSASDLCPTSAPGFSNLNIAAGTNLPNRVIVPLGPANDVCVYNSAGTINFILDVNGWFGNGGESSPGASFYAIAPLRICDTRSTTVTGYGTECSGNELTQGESLSFEVAGVDGLPPAAGSSPPVALIANVTATGGNADTYFTLYPSDVAQPSASDLNIVPGQTVPNLVIVQLATTGAHPGWADLFNASGSINAVVDVAGWFQ